MIIDAIDGAHLQQNQLMTEKCFFFDYNCFFLCADHFSNESNNNDSKKKDNKDKKKDEVKDKDSDSEFGSNTGGFKMQEFRVDASGNAKSGSYLKRS
jgi:hypothetical protein